MKVSEIVQKVRGLEFTATFQGLLIIYLVTQDIAGILAQFFRAVLLLVATLYLVSHLAYCILGKWNS